MTSTRTPRQQSLKLPTPALPELDSDGNHGEFFTLAWVVDLILDLIGYDESRDLAAVRLVEPSCGDGAFIRPIARRLIASCKTHSRPLTDVVDSVRTFDLQIKNVETTRKAVADEFVSAGLGEAAAADIADAWVHHADFLLEHHQEDAIDFVVGNPPYVRPEDVSPERMALYRQRCRTMTGRADIYIGFYEIGLEMLAEDGVLGFICADRWMRNSYGKKLRELVSSEHSVDVLLEMHDVTAFAKDVSAYPSITVLRRGQQGRAVVAEATAGFGEHEANDVSEWIRGKPSPEAQHIMPSGSSFGVLDGWYTGGSSWPTGTPERLKLLRELESRLPPLEGGGTRVGIGVATGADSVFITNDSELVEKDRLLPLAMTKDTTSGTLDWSGNFLVNPWKAEGGLVTLQDFPRLAKYFEENDERLTGRHVAKKRPESWYRTIDPVNASLTAKAKLLFPDMKMTSHPVLDSGGHYPHHNLYYVISQDWDLEVLGGLLLSRVAQFFIEAYAVRMRGGTLRFQAQYLRRIRIPRPEDISAKTAIGLRESFANRDVASATAHALSAYGLESLPN